LDTAYEIEVVDCKPKDAIGLVDSDVNLLFEEPKDFAQNQPVFLSALFINHWH
jgi:hypothetical protein